MKKTDSGPILKVVVVLLIAALLIGAITVAANGGQRQTSTDRDLTEEKHTNEPTQPPEKQTDGDAVQTILPADEPPSPSYENRLTGLSCSEKTASATPLCFVTDPQAPLYGIFSADLTVEIPIEGGKTRMLLFESDPSSLGKIGALAPGRAYIDSVARFFGGIAVSFGRDDLVQYSSLAPIGAVDLSSTGYCYMESVRYAFTGGDAASSCVASLGLSGDGADKPDLPFSFEAGSLPASAGATAAPAIAIPYSDAGGSSFRYSEEEQKYVLSVDGKVKTDLLTGRKCSYENLIVLFADTISYGRSNGTETIIDTLSGGSGYYLCQGRLTEIRWSVGESGNLIFRTLSGEKLVVSRGKTYIGYYPSSSSYDVTLE